MATSKGRTIRGLAPEDRRRQRRQELLDSALELFAANGYAATSIEQICQHAMVGNKAFYEEFATKEQLFIELYDTIGGRLLPVVFEAFNAAEPGDGWLTTIVAAYIRAAMADPRVARVLFLTSAGVSEAVDLHRRTAHRLFAAFFADVYRAGLVSDGNVKGNPHGNAIALGVTGGMGEVVVDFLIDPGERDVDDLVADLVAFVNTVVVGLTTPVAPAPDRPPPAKGPRPRKPKA